MSHGALLIALAASSTACSFFGRGGSGPSGGGVQIPSAPREQARCRVDASQSTPLVTEWPASEKANLEGLVGSGAVAVAYSGCAMRVLPQCRPRGTYHWQRTTTATDVVEINDTDELFAKLPLGAASLEGELKRSGKLSVKTVVAGQMKLHGFSPAELTVDPSCAGATHVVAALSVGAFTLTSGRSVSGKVKASMTGVGEGGGGPERSEGLIRAAGNGDSCGDSTADAAHANCRSPIQVFLQALPGRGLEEGPPGTVQANFVSDDAHLRWDVLADDEVICTTPCSRWVNPLRPVTLRERNYNIKLTVTRLKDTGTPLQVEAHGLANGRFVGGMTVGGLGVLTSMVGGMLSLMNCRHEPPNGCTASLITIAVGVPIAVAGYWLMSTAQPYADVRGRD